VYRVGKGRAGRELDGRTWDEFPTPLAVGAGDLADAHPGVFVASRLWMPRNTRLP
jgi:hypothetical protein